MAKAIIRSLLVFCSVATLFFSCIEKKQDATIPATEENNLLDTNATNDDFFPVTTYLKGQVYEIINNNINPVMITNDGFKIDSVILKMENFEKEIATFLDPVIDTANLKKEFKQTSFKDATLNKITFTYTPTALHSASSPLKSWNVYIDPETNKVTGIYILKKTPAVGTEHLTWEAGKKCTIQLLKEDKLVYERSIIWNFDKND